ncbi:MAG: lysophospholipid acyltransferase family protein [Candidatus Tritonobacter lacicola]|nr:lysophospholipid acyltransferase family protein [Candidatus Tritonobacter lacicola]
MVIGESIIKDIVRPFIWFGLRRLVLLLPAGREFLMYRAMGRAYYLLAPGKRAQLLSNLAALLGERGDLRSIAGKCVENHFVDRYLNFSFSKITGATLHRYVSIEGLERLDAALARGKGCVLVHAHFGPSQLPLFALGMHGYRVNQVGGPDVRGLSKLGRYCLKKFREDEKKIPVRIIQSDEFLRPVFDCLKRNEVLMTAGDGTGGRRFIGKSFPFRFMGRILSFPIGAASIAARTGAAYVPIFVEQGKKGSCYSVVICPEIQVEKAGSIEETAVLMTEKFLELFSKVLRRYPHLWHFWDELDCRLTDS